MKRIVLLWMLLFALGTAEAQVHFVSGSTEKLRELATQEGKLLFIDLYAPWCGPCRVMDNEVFSRREVGDFFAQHFVAAKYNVDRPTGSQLMRRHGRGAIPLYLVFSTDGELLGRIEGSSSAEKLMADLQRILSHAKKQPAD